MSQPESVEYCPFLDRGDRRCAAHLSLDNLEHALDHCFNRYKACPTHMQLLVEKRVRLATGGVLATTTLTIGGARDGAQRRTTATATAVSSAIAATACAPLARRDQ